MLRIDPPNKRRKTESVTLYNLDADPAQENNLADERPDKVQSMRRALADWRESVKASFEGDDYLVNE